MPEKPIIITDERFSTWEEEKAHKMRELTKLNNYGSQLAQWLSHFGMGPDITAARINAIITLLLDAGLVSEQDIMNNEIKYAESLIEEMENDTQGVRTEAIKKGIKLPPMPTKSGITLIKG